MRAGFHEAQQKAPNPSFRAYLVGVYLFSVPAFAYSETLGLLMIPQITGALLVAYALFDVLRNLRIQIPKEIGLYGLMGLWAIITLLFGGSPNEWRTLSLGTLIKVVIATLACAQLIKDYNDLYTALKIFVFSILFVYYQNMSDIQYLSIADKIPEMDRFAGTFSDPNNAAIFSLTVIWASILLLLHSRKGFLRGVWLLVPIAISLMIIYYSGSKKGLIGLGLFVLFLGRLMYTRQQSSVYKKGLVVLVSFALILVVGYFIYVSPFFFRLEQLLYGGSGGDINRVYLARDAINIWLRDWKTFFIGVGYDNFRFVSDLQSNSHATPLELLACNGIIGFSLFMGFFFLLFRKFIRLYRKANDPETKRIFFSIIIFLSIYTFFMLAHVLHVSRELLPIMGCLAAFGQYHLRLGRQDQGKELNAPAL
jgi:O-antigen ligase